MSIFTYIKSHAVAASAIAVVAVVVAAVAGRNASQKPPTEAPAAVKAVATVDVSAFRNGTSTVSVVGDVESHSQADLKAQIGAPVAAISASIGDTVYAGQTILELQNSDIKAQLDSARAGLTIAEGQYVSAKQGAVDKIQSAYSAALGAVHTNVDPLILNNTQAGVVPTLFAYYAPDVQLAQQITDERSTLTNSFVSWKNAADGLSATSTDQQVLSVISLSQGYLDDITHLLDDISTELSDAARRTTPSNLSTVTGYQTAVSTARASVAAAQSGLTAAVTSLEGAQTTAGSAASAGVGVAQSSLRNLQAQLAKTIVAAPFTGKIAALPLRVGEFAAPGTLLATLVGGDGLLVKAHASGEDLSRIRPGATALIQGGAKGVVSNVAPSLNSATKQAEVDIDITDPGSAGLDIGATVSASVAAQPRAGDIVYRVPIQDVKIVPGGAYVYTIGSDSKAVQHEVTLGSVSGDFVEVTGGLQDGMEIIAPVYEIEDGQTVSASAH